MNCVKSKVLLDNLKKSLEKIKSLVAWQQLKQSEHRPGHPPAFEMYNPIPDDLNNEYSRILMHISEFQRVLNGRKVRTLQFIRIRRDFLKIKQELDALNIPLRIRGLS